MTTLEEIDAWASVLTGENRSGKEFYYVSEPVKRLHWKLMHLQRQLIALVGLQGTGKTSALWYLQEIFYNKENRESNAVMVKWIDGWLERLADDDARKAVRDQLIEEIVEVFETYGLKRKEHHYLKRIPNREDVDKENIHRLFGDMGFRPESILGTAKVKEITEIGVREYISSRKVLLIDLPDYTKTDKRLMTRDLAEIQDLWEKLYSPREVNIVVSIQKELFGGHFFFGKMDVIELLPLKPEEFIYIFKTKFPDCTLITDDALLLLGQLSRGVFRRFLKYLSLTVESFAVLNGVPPINVNHVNAAITIEQLVKDMELELYDILKNVQQRRQAVELLDYLRQKNETNQKDIAELLNISEATAGKLVNKLVAVNYLQRKRGEGKEWIISLKT
jgi:predicted XRE-type DNA-binding protein